MRTINEKLKHRLLAQAEEAGVLKMEKVSAHLTDIVKRADVRSNAVGYTYSSSDLISDVEKPLWNAVIRIADYYDCNVDASGMQNIIEKIAAGLIKEVQVGAGIKHGVGAYEPTVPGEERSSLVIEIDDDRTESERTKI